MFIAALALFGAMVVALLLGAESLAGLCMMTALGITLVLYLFGPRLALVKDSLIRTITARDKLLHLILSLLIVQVVSSISFEILGIRIQFDLLDAVLIAALVGLAKELIDRFIRKGKVSVGDLVADAVGIVVGAVLVIL
jgi:VanZ family protein